MMRTAAAGTQGKTQWPHSVAGLLARNDLYVILDYIDCIAQHGSILESQNKDFLKNLVKDDKQFTQLFLEGLESTAHQVEDQQFMSRKQVIFVSGRQFDFTQHDPIFKLSRPNLP